VLQCVAVCCSVLQCGAACCSVLQCVAVCCSALYVGRWSWTYELFSWICAFLFMEIEVSFHRYTYRPLFIDVRVFHNEQVFFLFYGFVSLFSFLFS